MSIRTFTNRKDEETGPVYLVIGYPVGSTDDQCRYTIGIYGTRSAAEKAVVKYQANRAWIREEWIQQ